METSTSNWYLNRFCIEKSLIGSRNLNIFTPPNILLSIFYYRIPQNWSIMFFNSTGVAAYNCGSLLNNSQLFTLKNEASKNNWGEQFIKLSFGNTVFGGYELQGLKVLWFLVKGSLNKNILKCKENFNRVAYFILQLSENCEVKPIQV